jgi:hypothetical protein
VGIGQSTNRARVIPTTLDEREESSSSMTIAALRSREQFAGISDP